MSLSKLTVRRLTKLADYLDSLPPKASNHFRMLHWFRHSGKDDHPFNANGITKRDLNFCGTSACAIGWAGTLPYFRRAGLKVEPSGRTTVNGNSGILASWEVLDPFFGLTRHQSAHLFGPYTRIKTPKQWAARCRKFLRDNA